MRGSDGTAESLVVRAARVLAGEGLVDAFGHVSARYDATTYLITPPRPLAAVGADDLVPVDVDAAPPPTAPREAWLHTVIYRRRPEVRGVARAQPPAAFVAGALPGSWCPAHGHGGLLGSVIPVHDEAKLARDQARAEAVVTTLGRHLAVVLRGNGALTVSVQGLDEAVAAMWVLEAAARVRVALIGAPDAQRLTADEVTSWEGLAPELLGRIWSYLASRHLPD
jgi:HCOMODA/2-hydroxy-3-carboxy-muconic semialdehyde decarboxylase